MKKFQHNTLKSLACSVSAMALVLSASAAAQDPVAEEETAEAPADITEDEADAQPESGSIVVTGSRIKRDTYSSISPLQVLTTEASQDAGLFDPAQILQRSEAASGQQIDATFQGFVLDNGPGSQTLNLRGLGADRTLLLVNGRRLAPAGVEGAPTNPSINLLPSSLIERYELLLDGASSVYGSDAVAGVGNIILRKDFDGPEFFAGGNINPEGGGDDYQVSGAYGFNTDRGFFGIGAEYSYRDEVKLRDRDFLAGCDTHYEVTDSGEIRTLDLASNALLQDRSGLTVSENACKVTSQVGRLVSPFQRFANLFYVDGPGNSGITNYNVFRPGGVDFDADGDGVGDIDFQDYNRNGANPDQTFISQQKLYNVMAYGEYTFAGAANITPFFEANYSRAEIFSDNSGLAQIFPIVPGSNPFNPCNLANNDCAAAEAGILGNPGGNSGFSLPVRPVVSVVGDRNNVEVTQEQYRGVFGVKGDLPFISPSWSFEVSGVYSKSIGKSTRLGIREDKLAFALGIDPTADFNGDGIIDNDTDRNGDDIPESPGDGIADDYDGNVNFPPETGGACNAAGLRNPDLALPDLTQGCVPVDLFGPNIMGQEAGLLSQAERDYLFGVRAFDTTYEQVMLSAFVTGDLFTLPAGNVAVVLGAEYREDKIDSSPNAVASNGLFFAFAADQGAQGSKWIREAFAEIDIPLQANKPWVEELNLNISGRITDEEFYGTAGTYSIKAGWRPISPLLLKFSYGTSFRAPNLRENFLAGQSGFASVTDPCAVPVGTLNAAFAYDPALETRDPEILANCQREGRDPTRVGIDPQNNNTTTGTTVENITGGTLDLDAETSRSMTAGAAFEETFGDGYDVSLGINYYDIKIKGAVVEPSAQFIINDCYARRDGTRSAFCDRIEFDDVNDPRQFVSQVRSGFINLNSEGVRGIDINASFGKDVALFGRLIDLGLNVRANHLLERSTLFIDDNGNASFDEDAGEFGFPSWTGLATFTADIDNLRFTWQTRYIGSVEQETVDIDPLSDAFRNGPDGAFTGFTADTCTGGGGPNGIVVGDGVYCRDVGYAGDYFTHTAALRYEMDSWTLRAGVSNVFDRRPPLVDSNEVFAVSNTPIGNGYDLDGREFFFSVAKAF
jgi:iron complex outermembrane receptor protein